MHAEADAHLLVNDLRRDVVTRAVQELGAQEVRGDEILHQRVDVFAPCALGLLTPTTVPQLRTKVVAGPANNQLSDPIAGDFLRQTATTKPPPAESG